MNKVSGLLPIFKPTGMTSKDVSRTLTRRFGKIKMGHVGTLDPDADGVLPVLLGSATKLQDYLVNMPKSYRFTITFGTATDSFDATGNVVATAPWQHVTRDAVDRELSTLTGQIIQTPPLYSAVKLDGKELYKHARGQQVVSPETLASLARKVTVYEIKVLRFAPPELELMVRCSKGTYVRSIGVDLAAKLSTVGHITALRREESAGITLDQCVPLTTMTSESTGILDFLRPLNRLAIGLPVLKTNDNVALQRLMSGQNIQMTRGELIEQLDTKDMGDACHRGILLQDSNGESVGIAEILSIVEQSVTIHLKRGL